MELNMEEEMLLLEIIRDFINNKETVTSNKSIDENKLYKLAKVHKVSNFLQKWADNNCISEEIKNKIQSDFNSQVIKDTNERIELEKVLDKFEENNIETVVVKGIIMKDIYPQNYMRQMCDMDILVHYEDYEKGSKILKDLDFSEYNDHKRHKKDHHLVFIKKPMFTLEMHRKLIPDERDGEEYFNNIWNSCIKYKNYNNVYKMNIEDAYIFCIVHMLKHFKTAGISIRDVLDVYVYNEKYRNEVNQSELSKKFEEIGIKEFEENIKKIAYKWFGNEEIFEFDDVEKYILGGARFSVSVQSAILNKGGKSKMIFRMFFPKYSKMKREYPFLKKIPVLLPIMWCIRIIDKVFLSDTSNKARLERLNLVRKTEINEVKVLGSIYKKVGI